MGATHSKGDGRVRTWPPARPPKSGESVRATCEHCGLSWDVHQAMAGFRLRCECDAWVAVPHPRLAPERQIAAPLSAAMPLAHPWDVEVTGGGAAEMELDPYAARDRRRLRERHEAFRRLHERRVERHVERARRREERHVRRRAKRELKRERRQRSPIRRAWRAGFFGSTLLVALMALPAIFVMRSVPQTAGVVLWPTWGVLALAPLALAALFGRTGFLDALRPAKWGHTFEGLGVGLALGSATLGMLLDGAPGRVSLEWLRGLVGELHPPLAAVSLVVLPALTHALFFREQLGTRLQALFPGWLAGLAGAAVLVAAHGFGPWTAPLSALALHAVWLQRRAKSAVPTLIEELAFAGVVFAGVLQA